MTLCTPQELNYAEILKNLCTFSVTFGRLPNTTCPILVKEQKENVLRKIFIIEANGQVLQLLL